MRAVISLVFAVTAAAAAFPVAAGASVVPQRSIAGVKLNMTVPQVKKILGKPKSDRAVPDEIQGTVRVLNYGLTQVTVGAQSGTVQGITTSSRKQRTSKGVGVGSTRATVAAKVPKVKCRSDFGFPRCLVGEELAGRTVTVFALSKAGKVARITLGYVID